MSRFDDLNTEFKAIQQSLFSESALIVLLAIMMAAVIGAFLAKFVSIVVVICLLILLSIPIFVLSISARDKRKVAIDRINELSAEMDFIKQSVRAIYNRYPPRPPKHLFKEHYRLAGLSLDLLEEALAVGMYQEQNEVFVTCFMRQGKCFRVTATIGSPFRCSPSDNIREWKTHFRYWGCDEILQYHNHPTTHNTTAPSPADYRSSRYFNEILGDISCHLRSLIIYWNEALEWRVLEYDADGNFRILRELDITHKLKQAQDNPVRRWRGIRG